MAFLKPTAFSFILKLTAVINAGVEYLKVKRNGYEMSFLQDSFRLNEISKKYTPSLQDQLYLHHHDFSQKDVIIYKTLHMDGKLDNIKYATIEP